MSRSPRWKLCEVAAGRIREAFLFGATRQDLRAAYGISNSTLNTVLRGASFQAPPDLTFQLLNRFCLAPRITV